METDDYKYSLWCIYQGDGNDEIEHCWHDCTHPQKEFSICPYETFEECSISVPDTKLIEEQKAEVELARNFWREHHKKKFDHICDFTLEQLRERHKNVLRLVGKHEPILIGTLLAGEYYGEAWGSRSCSGHLACLVGTNDYMDFYCGGSTYAIIKVFRPSSDPMLVDFEEADKLDREEN
jgi:hypothetical protein